MTFDCQKWLSLMAAYKAGQLSNQGIVNADEERAKVDDSVSRKSDAAVDDSLSKWNRD